MIARRPTFGRCGERDGPIGGVLAAAKHQRITGGLRIGLARWLLCMCGAVAVLLGAGCISKPVQIRVLRADTGSPIEGAEIRQHGARFLRFLPKRNAKPSVTGADGVASLILDARGTSLAVLCQGFVPVQVSIVPEPRGCAEPSKPTALEVTVPKDLCVPFESLADRARLDVQLLPLRASTLRVCVRDENGEAMAGAAVIVECSLFLPADGMEAAWGLPAAQRLTAGSDGCVHVQCFHPLRAYAYARMAGYSPERTRIDREPDGGTATLQMRRLQWKKSALRVVDAKTDAPIAAAEVQFGKELDGVPRDPNGWVVACDSQGITPPVDLPNVDQLVLTVSAKGYRTARCVVQWASIRAGRPPELALERQ